MLLNSELQNITLHEIQFCSIPSCLVFMAVSIAVNSMTDIGLPTTL